MKDSIAARLGSLEARLKEIDLRLSDPDVTSDLDNYRKLSQERAEIQPVVEVFLQYRAAEGNAAANYHKDRRNRRDLMPANPGPARRCCRRCKSRGCSIRGLSMLN